jgi:hypothetical protein
MEHSNRFTATVIIIEICKSLCISDQRAAFSSASPTFSPISGPGDNVIKTFSFVADDEAK